MPKWYVLGKLCERNTCSGIATVQLLDKLSMVLFHWLPSQELQSSMENSKREKRKFREEEEEEELEEKPRTKKRKTVRHS